MKTILKRKELLALLLIMFLAYSCSDEDLDPNDRPVNPEADDINSYIRQLPEWKNQAIEQVDSTYIEDVIVPSDGIQFKCDIYEKKLVRSLQNIISVETNFGTIWPGALIQGKTLESGEIQPVTLDRSPITIQTDLPLTETFKEISDPSSISVQQGIADFQVASGQMPEGSEAGAGLMNFSVEEVASFEQAMLSMGISGGFTEPQSQVGLEASTNVSVERAFNEHTIIAKFVQEMFTVRLADDLLPEPSDFFAPDVSMSEIQALKGKGELGEDNLPLYIESVTYGRIMLFTMTSTNVSSAAELTAAVEASMEDYVKGGASLTAKQEEILAESSTTIFSAGGTKDAANMAIASLNWSEFFKAAPATTAIPISFVAKTLNGKKIVKIIDNAVYKQRSRCDQPSSYSISVEWTDSENSGLCVVGTCPRQVFVVPPGANVGTALTILNSYTYNMTFTKDDIGTQNGRSFKIQSIVELLLPGGALSTKTEQDTFDVLELDDGNNTRQHLLQNYAGSVALTFNIRKVTNYED